MHVGLSTVLAVAVPQPRALTSLSRPVAARPVATDDRNGTTIDWNKLDVSILNLDSRVDRLAALVDTIEYPLLPGTGAPFALHQACRVPAVNATAIGAELPSTGLIYDNIWKEANDRLKRNQMTMGGPLTPGSVGCGISHALAWKRLVDAGLPYGLILEDDTRVFYAHTVQRTGGYPKGQRVLVHDREWERLPEEEPSVGRPALVLRSPSLLRYDVQFDDGEIQKNVRHTHIEPPPLPPDLLHLRRGEIQASRGAQGAGTGQVARGAVEDFGCG